MPLLRHIPTALIASTVALSVLHCGSTAPVSGEDAGKPKGDSSTKHDSSTHGDAANKGDSSRSCTPTTPTSHRATATACSTTRPPSQPGDASVPDGGGIGGCTVDSECTAGTNGRCGRDGQIIGCTYDDCSTDATCGAGKLCECGAPNGAGRGPNVCIPSNCDTDSDCGTGGYCSPTYDTTCGGFDGVVGYFCHKAADECTMDQCVNDSDCAMESDGGVMTSAGYCAWDPSSSRWGCFYSFCAG
jgi:Cys-rich repeat protein